MTREEAKRRMEICRNFLANNYSDMGEPNFTAFNMAIQALSQEPCRYWKNGKCNGNTEVCDDAISRKDIQDYIAKYLSQYLYDDVRQAVEVIDAYIEDMPSVTQKSKTGHREYNDIYDHYLCGNCKTVVMNYDNYCPNCGCRMIEPQESEDDEQIKVGTKVRTIKDKDFAGEEVFPVETIGIVEEIRKGGKLPYIIRANSDYWYYSRDMFEVIEDIEPQERSGEE